MDQLNNTKRLSVLTTILLVCLAASCLAQEQPKDSMKKEWRDFFGSSISSRDCKPADDSENQGARICKGVEGYSFLLKGDDLKPEVYLITPNGRQYQVRYWNTNDPKYQELQSSVRWIVVNTPRKTISVTFTANIAPRQDYSEWGSYDIIARVSPGPVCVIGSVAAGPSAIAESVAIASSPGGRRCLTLEQLEKKNWFATTRRLATEGQITAAKFAVTKVQDPHERFLLYREIASAYGPSR